MYYIPNNTSLSIVLKILCVGGLKKKKKEKRVEYSTIYVGALVIVLKIFDEF